MSFVITLRPSWCYIFIWQENPLGVSKQLEGGFPIGDTGWFTCSQLYFVEAISFQLKSPLETCRFPPAWQVLSQQIMQQLHFISWIWLCRSAVWDACSCSFGICSVPRLFMFYSFRPRHWYWSRNACFSTLSLLFIFDSPCISLFLSSSSFLPCNSLTVLPVPCF